MTADPVAGQLESPTKSCPRISEVLGWLEDLAPARLAESWDNVGLLFGDPSSSVRRVMTCLTVTRATAEEAIDRKVDLIVSHHPILFRAVKTLRADDPVQGFLWDLARAGIAVASPHTAFDNAIGGINEGLARAIGLHDVGPLCAARDSTLPGTGRLGRFETPISVDAFAKLVMASLGQRTLVHAGAPARGHIERVAIVCGAGSDFLKSAHEAGADALLTGEGSYHKGVEAQERGILLAIAGHHATERPGVEALAAVLGAFFPTLEVWASAREQDPFLSHHLP